MAAKNMLAQPVRSVLLSNVRQNLLATPRMTSPSSDFLANFSRFLSQAAGTPGPSADDVGKFLPAQ